MDHGSIVEAPKDHLVYMPEEEWKFVPEEHMP
jgi:hypothetical protein